MKKLLMCVVLLLLLGVASAENAPEADISPVQIFAAEYSADLDVQGIYNSAREGKIDLSSLKKMAQKAAAEPVQEAIRYAGMLIVPVLLLAVTGCILQNGSAARFALLLALCAGMVGAVLPAIEAAAECLRMTKQFSDSIAPSVAALVTAVGMSSSAALVSPAAALAGSFAEGLFMDIGLPICRCALAVAASGSLCRAIDLDRAFQFLKKMVGWGTGLCFTCFTALIALQGSAAQAADNLALRTAKYAVDSAAPVIGSGVSDVWESYVSGIFAAKNALGASGVIALIAAGFRPLIRIGVAMLVLQLTAVLLDVLGEKAAARCAGQMGGVCRMALELCAGALAIATILLGAVMSVGRGLLG